MMDRLLTAGLCGNTIGQDIQTRGDSRVSGYPGLRSKICYYFISMIGQFI